MMNILDLQKEYLIHVCMDRTVTVRKRGEPVFNGSALPVWSTDTKEQAIELIVMLCTAQAEEHPLLPGETWYAIPMSKQYLDIEDLDIIAQKFRETEEWMKQRNESN